MNGSDLLLNTKSCPFFQQGYEIDMQIMFGKCEHSVQMHFNEV